MTPYEIVSRVAMTYFPHLPPKHRCELVEALIDPAELAARIEAGRVRDTQRFNAFMARQPRVPFPVSIRQIRGAL